MNKIKILGIETSCDETALAVIEADGGLTRPRFKVLKNLVASQIKIHRPFGGVVPNLAKREHLKNLPILYKKIENSKLKIENCDLVAVTVGPGLEPALWTGINFAQELQKRQTLGAKRRAISVGANHLEGHLYSFLLSKSYSNILKNIGIRNLFPAVALIASGGHTILLKMESLSKWKKLGETRDDAAGEAFDKVARLLQLPYPGGPEIEKIALRQAQGKHPRGTINFPRPMLNQKNYDFSFSGLKTAVLYYLRNQNSYENTKQYESTKKSGNEPFRNFVQFRTFVSRADIAASFQQAAVDVLVAKTIRAAKEFSAKSVMLSGGVAANKKLRSVMSRESRVVGLKFFVPDFKYNADNAVMIAVAGYMAYLRKKKYKLVAQGNLSI